MKFTVEIDDEKLAAAIEVALDRLRRDREAADSKLNGRMGFPEAEAASLLGVPRHVLRDARLRNEISAVRVGKKIVYAKEELLAYLTRTRSRQGG